MENRESKQVSRRSFLKGAAVLGAGAAAAGALAACSPKADGGQSAGPTASGADIAWDATYDVIVAGTGCAAFAALYAADQGAQVALLEKRNMFGGTATLSGGTFWCPQNHIMTDAGYEDNREDALKFMANAGEGLQNDAACEAFVDRCSDWIAWTEESLGWTWIPNDATAWGYEFGSYNEYVDYDGYREFGRSIKLGSTLDPDDEQYMDAAKEWNNLRKQVEGNEAIDLQYETEVSKLYVNDAGEVVGVRVIQDNKELNYKANRGVVLGTGSFDWNEEWRRRYLHTPIFNSVAVPESTGDGQRMGAEIGAKLDLMSNVWGCAVACSLDSVPTGLALTDFSVMNNDIARYDAWTRRGAPNCLLVNQRGERFTNESANYHTFNRGFEGWDSGRLAPANFPAYFIGDANFFKYYDLPMTNYGAGEGVGVVAEGTSVFDTLEEVAEACGIEYERLKRTIDEFNEYARNGFDPDFERGQHIFDRTTCVDRNGREDLVDRCLGTVEQPPFYVNAYLPGTLGSCGGLVIDAAGRVVSEKGEAIPRLYACGNCTASIGGNGYGGAGYTLSIGAVMGWLAVEDMMKLESLA